MNFVRILNQYQLFYQQLEVKLIDLLQFFVFWKISWEWWESLRVTDYILSYYELKVLNAIATAEELIFFTSFYKFFFKMIDTYEWMVVTSLYDSQNKSVFVLILDLHGKEMRSSFDQLCNGLNNSLQHIIDHNLWILYI